MRFLNTSDLMTSDWRFLEGVSDDQSTSWETFSGVPNNSIERAIRRPHLGRWRAAASAARAAERGEKSVLVSHLPNMTAATNWMRKIFSPSTPHIAFAFNFTDLPGGRRLDYFRHSLIGIDEFVVFSRYERQVYSELFSIPEQKIRFLPWAMEAPMPGPAGPLPPNFLSSGYVCAIGGEGRDYALVADAMRQRPSQKMAIVARPYSIQGIDFPENVSVFTNLPLPLTWRLAVESKGLLVPLKTDKTACGHITVVGAKMLGIPLVVSRSVGVEDYIDDACAQVVDVANLSSLLAAVDRLYEDRRSIEDLARVGQSRAYAENNLLGWSDYFEELAQRFGKAPSLDRPGVSP